jgi:hypothetical protein
MAASSVLSGVTPWEPSGGRNYAGNGSIGDVHNMARGNQITRREFNDVLDRYFGTGNREVVPNPYDSHPITHQHLPDAYRGQSELLASTVIGLVSRNNEWPTSLALPWAYSEQFTFKWTEYTFNNTLAGKVPIEGVPRLLTSNMKTMSQGTTRRGIAFQIEHGFWATAQGQQQYARNWAGIKNCIQETANWDVCHSISTSRDANREDDRDKGHRYSSMGAVMEKEIEEFAIVQKSDNGTNRAVAAMEKGLSRWGIKPTLMIVPPNFRSIYGQLDEKTTQYWAAGPTGVAQLRRGPNTLGAIGSMMIVETREPDVNRVDAPIEPFLPCVASAEVMLMADEYADSNHDGFHSGWRSIIIWNETGQQWKKVSLKEALVNSHRFNSRGKLHENHWKLAALVTDKQKADFSNPQPRQPVNYSRYYGQSTHPTYYGASDLQQEQGLMKRLSDEYRDFLIYQKSDKTFGVVTFFGLMTHMAASDDDFRLMASTAASKFMKEGTYSLISAGLKDLRELIRESENTHASNEYLYGLMNENASRQQVNNKTIGQTTAADVLEHQCLIACHEMVPNDFGGLNQPSRIDYPGLASMNVPPFINSWPSLVSLTFEYRNGKGWDDVAERARNCVRAVREVLDRCQKLLYTSAFLDPRNRRPWFQQADPFTTAFSEVIGLGPRDGVFLRFLPHMIGGGAQPATAAIKDDKWNARVLAMTNSNAATFDRVLGSLFVGPNVTLRDEIAKVTGEKGTQELLFTFVQKLAFDGLDIDALTDAGCVDAFNKVKNLLAYFAELKDEVSKKRDATLLSKLYDSTTDAAEMGSAVALITKIVAPTGVKGKKAAQTAAVVAEEADKIKAAFTELAKAAGKNPVYGRPAPQQPGAPQALEITDDQWDKGFWIRAPLNSYLRFAQDSLVQDFPLALPSDPDFAHLVPISMETRNEASLLETLKRPHYTEEPIMAGFSGGLATSDAGIVYEFPEELRAMAPASFTAQAASAHRLRGQATNGAATTPSAGSTGLPMGAFFKRALAGSNKPTTPSEPHISTQYSNTPREQVSRFHPYNEPMSMKTSLGGGAGGKPNEQFVDYFKTAPKALAQSFNEVRSIFHEPNFVYRWRFGRDIQDPIVRIFHQIFLGCTTTELDQWTAMIDGDMNIPVTIFLWRPWVIRMMHQLPCLRGGLDTGMTAYGHTSATASDDGLTRVHYVQVQFNQAVIIVEPRAISAINAAIANRYLGGRGCTWVTSTSDTEVGGVNFHGNNPGAGDIIATATGYSDRELPAFSSLMGEWVTPLLDKDNLSNAERQKHYHSALYYTLLFNLRDLAQQAMVMQQELRYGQSNVGIGLLPTPIGMFATYDQNQNSCSRPHWPTNSHYGNTGGVGGPAAAILNGRFALLPQTPLEVGFTGY